MLCLAVGVAVAQEAEILTGRLLLYLYAWLDKLFLKLSAQPDEMNLCPTVHSYLRL